MPSTLITLLDDIASVLDDVAVLTKVATKKTAGVLGDDLALNAQQVTGVTPDRELPVVWAVAVGSVKNKAILIPAALALSAFLPVAVVPLLMFGGAFLCYEGFHKIAEKLFHKPEVEAHEAQHKAAVANPAIDIVALEKDKVKGAIRTDFILSAEIIAITLGEVAGKPFGTQLAVLLLIGTLMTVGVYGLVAGIVKLDDGGLALSKRGGARKALGVAILAGAPYLMKGLSIAGTAAMFLVGGGILVHGIEPLHHAVQGWAAKAGGLGSLVEAAANFVVGVVAGGIAVGGVSLVQKLRPARG